MSIEFHCDHCGKILRTADDKAGRQAKCPSCGEPVTVPEAGENETHDASFATWENETYGVAEPESSSHGSPAGEAVLTPDWQTCPMCGQQIQASAAKCRYCGEELESGPAAGSVPLRPHRGGLILALGILSWVVCIVCGVMAWTMGNQDLQDMQAGRMDPSGEGMTKAGKIVGMVHVILFAFVLVFYCLVVAVAFP